MKLRDVLLLLDAESKGERVISWHSKALWDSRKNDVVDDETALRLSKMLRDNRHTFMDIFNKILDEGFLTFLATAFLELNYAEYDVEFVNLRVENSITRFDKNIKNKRETKYAEIQKARRCRIAFDSLKAYFAKESRNAYIVSTHETYTNLSDTFSLLRDSSDDVSYLDNSLKDLVESENKESTDVGFKEVVNDIPSYSDIEEFDEARNYLEELMGLVANELSALWENDRYVRAELGD